jgi:hypothetical protein
MFKKFLKYSFLALSLAACGEDDNGPNQQEVQKALDEARKCDDKAGDSCVFISSRCLCQSAINSKSQDKLRSLLENYKCRDSVNSCPYLIDPICYNGLCLATQE